MAPDLIEIPYQESSFDLLMAFSDCDRISLLDSAYSEHTNARWSIFSCNPVKSITYGLSNIEEAKKLVEELHGALPYFESDFPFVGGVIGSMPYEAANLKVQGVRNGNIADQAQSAEANLYTWVILSDHKSHKRFLIHWPNMSIHSSEWVIHKLNSSSETTAIKLAKPFQACQSKESYLEAFSKIKNYILEGDTYQINLTQRFETEYTGNPITAYSYIQSKAKKPFSCFIQNPERTLINVSPERFIQLSSQNIVQTKPIKGTRPRSLDPEIDKQLLEELASSEKDRSENLMIVDLLRNDLSKTCTNVNTPKLFEVESFSTVHHLVSTVEGSLPTSITPFDVFINAFPGGSITGAPKIRAMEIINEIELYPRSLYCGSVFYWSINNKFDSNILIRSIEFKNGSAYCWGGGGIIADSDATSEYQESIDKVQAMMKWLEEFTIS